MIKKGKYLDMGSFLVIVITFVLFVAALFTKGLTRDILLEAAVFLVSVKLIMMAYRNAVTAEATNEKLDAISIKLGLKPSVKP